MKWQNMNSCKGISVGDMSNAALVIIFLGVVLSVGSYMQGQIADTSFDTTAELNEQITWVNNASYMIVKYPYIKSVEGINNGTTWLATKPYFTSGNFSFKSDGSGGVLCCKTCGTAACNENTTLWINYTAWTGSEYYTIKNGTAGLRNISTWLPIIAVVIAAAIVVGTLTSYFRKDNF